MSNTATEQMLLAVHTTQESADQAEKEYNRDAERIQAKAGRSINLFGGSAASQVADIASESKKACDALYASYQMLVKILDSQCRPLLDQTPQILAVRAVRDLIKWLNDESEIKNNFTASLNAYDLGDVVSVRYIPSVENKMIQSFWEATYHAFPGREDFELREKELLQKELAHSKQQLNDRRAGEIKKQEDYHRSVVEWVAAAEEITNQRKQQINEALAIEEASLRENYLQTRDSSISALEKEKAEVEKQYTAVKEQLASAGFFNFAEKKQLKIMLEALEKTRTSIHESIEKARNDYEQALANLDDLLKKKKASISNVVGKKLPIPTAPAPLYEKGTTFADKLLEVLQEHGGMLTVQEIMDHCPEASEHGFQRTAYVLRGMIGTKVERIESQRQAYFRSIEKFVPEESAILELLKKMKKATFYQLANDPKLMKIKVEQISVALCVLLDRGKIIRYLQNDNVYFELK